VRWKKEDRLDAFGAAAALIVPHLEGLADLHQPRVLVAGGLVEADLAWITWRSGGTPGRIATEQTASPECSVAHEPQ
jgi:hypothetical protein